MLAFIFVFILSSANAGVTAADFVVDLNADLSPRDQLDTQAIREDLSVLEAGLARAYAGPRFSLSTVSVAETDSAGLCNRLAALFEGVNDSHLRASSNFVTCGTPAPGGRVGRNVAEGDRWSLKTMTHNGRPVDVLALPRFWPRGDARWDGFLNAARDLRARGRSFILDLRGNRGGDDSFGFEFTRVLLGLPEVVTLPSPVLHRRFLQSAESFALQSNQWAWSILKLRAGGQPVPPYMQQRRDELLDWMRRAERGEFPHEYLETMPQTKVDQADAFRAPVIVLVDRACASACETTLQTLEFLPRRILVGENTAGMVEYGEYGKLILPNSRVAVSISTMRVQFRDGRRPEKIGYAPQVRVREGGDALRVALGRYF